MSTHNATHPESAAHPAPRPSPAGNLLVASFGTLMLALAAGALWLLLCLFAPRLRAEDWLALPLALVIGPMVRQWMIHDRRHAAWLAAAAMLAAAAYMRVLLVATDLAGSFGMGFVEALRHAGASMLLHLAWMSVDAMDIAVYGASALVAATLAWRARPLTRR